MEEQKATASGRFHTPLEQRIPLPKVAPAASLALPGDAIYAPEQNTLRGHGIFWTPSDESKVLRATLAGTVERINKLVTIRSWRGRYVPNVGDVVVGRIAQVLPASRRWKVDIQARQDAVLTLFAIRLPGAVQRRRTREDELNMRAFYAETDLIAAEVQEIKADGSIMLHTRLEDKFGRLSQFGVFVSVPPGLIRRTGRAFASLGYPHLWVVLGVNGYIWIYWNPEETDRAGAVADEAEPTSTSLLTTGDAEALCRARNAVLVLSMLSLNVSIESIRYVFAAGAVTDPAAMLEPRFLQAMQKMLGE